MILSDQEIREAIQQGRIIVDPEPQLDQYATTSLDLLLGNELFEWISPEELAAKEVRGVRRSFIVDPRNLDFRELRATYSREMMRENDGSFILSPGRFVLGITREYIELPPNSQIAARVEGRSSLARLGLVVHFTAPTIQSGFKGQIALEMCNFGPYDLQLSPGLAVCQLIFERVGQRPEGELRTQFQGQRNP